MTASIRRIPEPTEPSERIGEGADLGRRAHVGATAELAREGLLPGPDLDDSDEVAVLLPEEHHRAEPPRLADRSLERVHGQVDEDPLVHDLPRLGLARLRSERCRA